MIVEEAYPVVKKGDDDYDQQQTMLCNKLSKARTFHLCLKTMHMGCLLDICYNSNLTGKCHLEEVDECMVKHISYGSSAIPLESTYRFRGKAQYKECVSRC